MLDFLARNYSGGHKATFSLEEQPTNHDSNPVSPAQSIEEVCLANR